jgi:hypothetical protein
VVAYSCFDEAWLFEFQRCNLVQVQSDSVEFPMKLYTCGKCNNLVYFENNVCLSCGHTLGFDATNLELITLTHEQDGIYADLSLSTRYRFCKNAAYGTCNWLIPVQYVNHFCLACQLNRTIPELQGPNLQRWSRIEVAKHRLVYSLMRLNLPVVPKVDSQTTGIAFDFLANVSLEKRVLTGHENGVITLNIEEADEAERVRNKLDLGEKYRTLLGHFRHEIGHYYWDVLIMNQPGLNSYRQLFGDENVDYKKALQMYYLNGPPADWANHFISPYASSHPWEDWAESWSHYMHLMDTLETAFYFGLHVNPGKQTTVENLGVEINKDPYTIENFQEVIESWLPLTFAVNSLNRSMGHQDFYPFVIAPEVVRKLGFIHDACKVK